MKRLIRMLKDLYGTYHRSSSIFKTYELWAEGVFWLTQEIEWNNSFNLSNFPLLMDTDYAHYTSTYQMAFPDAHCVTVFAESGSQRFWFKSVTSLRLNFRGILRLWALTAALIADALCLSSTWHVDSFWNAFFVRNPHWPDSASSLWRRQILIFPVKKKNCYLKLWCLQNSLFRSV